MSKFLTQMQSDRDPRLRAGGEGLFWPGSHILSATQWPEVSLFPLRFLGVLPSNPTSSSLVECVLRVQRRGRPMASRMPPGRLRAACCLWCMRQAEDAGELLRSVWAWRWPFC